MKIIFVILPAAVSGLFIIAGNCCFRQEVCVT